MSLTREELERQLNMYNDTMPDRYNDLNTQPDIDVDTYPYNKLVKLAAKLGIVGFLGYRLYKQKPSKKKSRRKKNDQRNR